MLHLYFSLSLPCHICRYYSIPLLLPSSCPRIPIPLTLSSLLPSCYRPPYPYFIPIPIFYLLIIILVPIFSYPPNPLTLLPPQSYPYNTYPFQGYLYPYPHSPLLPPTISQPSTIPSLSPLLPPTILSTLHYPYPCPPHPLTPRAELASLAQLKRYATVLAKTPCICMVVAMATIAGSGQDRQVVNALVELIAKRREK